MGFQKIERLACLIREDKGLRLSCMCGHVAEPDIKELHRKMHVRRGGFWAKLTELRQHMCCGKCGRKDFQLEIIPLTATSED